MYEKRGINIFAQIFCLMNTVLYVLFFVLSVFGSSDLREIDKTIGAALKNADAKELSKHFTSSVKLSIYRDEQIATKYQAELILSEYLKDNKLQEIKKLPLSEEQSNNYFIYEAKTQNRKVRIFIKVVKLKNNEFISEFRVE